MTQPIYAIGDIHGQIAMLDTALARIDRDGGANARIVFLGDYVDRGPDSRAVIETLAEGIAAGRNWVCLTGNHDRMFAQFLQDQPPIETRLPVRYDWLHAGWAESRPCNPMASRWASATSSTKSRTGPARLSRTPIGRFSTLCPMPMPKPGCCLSMPGYVPVCRLRPRTRTT